MATVRLTATIMQQYINLADTDAKENCPQNTPGSSTIA